MNDVIAIVVYNRLENLQHWLDCWKKCDQGATLVVIHNTDSPDPEYKRLCKDVIYIERPNIGFDIGAFQDVCAGRLKGFPEWDRLLWCTDDTLPMAQDFVQQYTSKMTKGVVCMDLSPFVRTHIRTTGFMISREVAKKLVFPADPIETKQQCYLFEHRWVGQTFYEQILKMGLTVTQVARREVSPLWDIGYHRKLNRKAEHVQIFGEFPLPETLEQKETTTFICPIYKSFPAVISSLIMQTNRNWVLLLIHDGPSDGSTESYVNAINDDRIHYSETREHKGSWGHSIRAEYLQKVKTKYVIVTNPDNWYAPVFIEKCLNKFASKSKIVAVFCSQMVHNYTQWGVINCRLARGFIDCGGVMLKTTEAADSGWTNVTDHSADWFFFLGIANKYGAGNFQSVPGCLFAHN